MIISGVVEGEGGECRSPKHFWGDVVPPNDIRTRGNDDSIPPSRLAKKYKIYGKLILRKIIEIVATRCHILKLKCAKFDFRPAGEAYSAPQPQLDLKGATSKGRERGGRAREGKYGRKG